MNSVAGTGQQYVNGQLTNREGGVLGDPKALADSITSSIDILSKNLFDIFNSDNSRIIKKLEGVRENTDATVKALLGQITGYAGGLTSPFGTIEGTKKEMDPWWRLGPLASKTTTTTVLASGVKIQGMLEDLINNTGNTVQQTFEKSLVETKKTYLGFISTDPKKTINTVTSPLEESFKQSFNQSLKYFKEAILETVDAFGGNLEDATEKLKKFPVNLEVNFKDLTATEALDKFSGEFSIMLNKIALSIYPWLEEFIQSGEEAGEAFSRLQRDSSNLKYGLSLLGIQFKETDLYLRTLAEQDFIKEFGGLEQFGDSINYYVDNFQDLTTKFNDQFGKLNKVFAESGLQVPNTKDKYAELVNSIKIQAETNEDARKKLATLILYSETYNAILEDRIQLEKTLEDLDQALYDLENNTSELTKALREIIKSGFEYYDVLKKNGQATQENITKVMKLNKLQALQKIDQDIKTLYETRRNEINKTIESLKAAKDRIVELKNALLQGTESTLTPLEKFSKLSSEYASTLEKARQGDQAAINKFPQVTQSLLSLGRELYSSSSVYTNLFDGVMGDLKSLDLSLDDQLTEAEQQLAQLESQTSFLEKIDTSTEATVKKLEQLIALRNAVSEIDPAARALQLFEGEKLGINRNDLVAYFNKAQQSLDAKAEINRLKLKANTDIAAKEANLLTTKSKLQNIDDIAANIAKFKETLKPENQDLLDLVTATEKILLADRDQATTFYNAAQVSLNDAKTARDLIVKAQTDAANAISLQEVLTAKAAAVSAATDVDKFLASVTTAQAAALEKINSFITFYQKVLAEYPQKLLESQQKALEAQLKAIVDAIQKYLDYALLQKPVSDKDPQLQQRVSDNLITLGDNITTTSKYLQSLIDTNAPQELIDWVTSIKNSMSADKVKADDFYSRALAEIKLLEKGKTDLAATLVAAKSATTIEQANALKLQAETQKAAVEAAASNAYQLLTAADAYSQKGIKTFNDALAELPNKLKPKLDTEIIKSGNTSGATIVGGGMLNSGNSSSRDFDYISTDIIKEGSIDPAFVVDEYGAGGDKIGDKLKPTIILTTADSTSTSQTDSSTMTSEQLDALNRSFDIDDAYSKFGVNLTDDQIAAIVASDEFAYQYGDGTNPVLTQAVEEIISNASAGFDSAGLSATNLTSSLTGADQALNNLGTSIADLNFDVNSLDQALGDGAKIGSIITDAQGSFVELTRGMDNGTRVIQTGDGSLSDASILQSATELVSTIVNASNPADAALLTAYAMGDITEARNNALISMAPDLTGGIINAVDTFIGDARLIAGAIYDSVTTGIDAFINDFTSLNLGLSPTAGGRNGIAGDFFVSANADGGPVMRSSPYIVGENGPELFVPKSNGTIISNTQVRQFQESNNQQLLAKIDQLIQAVAEGAVINVRATRENTEEIAQVISNNTNVIRAQNRVGIK